MAFTFANMAAAAAGAANANGASALDGPDLREIQVDQLGFAGLNRDTETQLRLLPEPWPADALPLPTASLLAVASSKGVLAAAGPSHLVLAATDKVRAALQAPDDKKLHKIRAFDPDVKLDKPRLAHVVFSSTDDVLVVSSQDTGGLDAFQLSSLLAAQPQPTLSLSTDGVPLRALVPNPNPKLASFMAAVTNNGHLLLADLEKGLFVDFEGSSGPSLLSGVSCVSWSNKGKQLVAGLASGGAVQLQPNGTVVAQIPRPAAIPDGHFVSTVSWLENDSFFFIYTPATTGDGILPSEYYIVTRRPQSQEYTFRKLPEIIPPYGLERIPSHHFVLRLRSFPPHLQDLLLLAATSGSDVGLLTKADQPLSQQDPVTGDFTVAVIGEDGKRAQLPLSDVSQTDTSPVGMALDLSSTEPVARPIPSDEEIQQTSGPCPNVLILNNEGVLLSWWLIYDDAVRQKTLFSGFSNLPTADESSSNPAAQPPTASVAAAAAAASSPSPFAAQSDRSKPAASFAAPSSAFAAPSSTFGASTANSAAPAFAQASTIGGAKPSWASTGFASAAPAQSSPGSAFGQPAFGSPAFGSPSVLGGGASCAPFGSAAAPAFGKPALAAAPAFGKPALAAAPAFGKPAFGPAAAATTGNTSTTSPFGATASKASGFAAFSGTGGFAAAAGGQASSPSPFASGSGSSAFAKPDASSSGFGASPFSALAANKTSSSSASPFSTVAGSASNTTRNPFGQPANFTLQSSFKADPRPDKDDESASDDAKPKSGGQSTFNFSNSLADILEPAPTKSTAPTHDREETMGDGEEDPAPAERAPEPARTNGTTATTTATATTDDKPTPKPTVPQTLVTPPSTLGAPKATPAPPVSDLFGSSTKPQPTSSTLPVSTGFSFGQPPTTTPQAPPSQLPQSTTPKDTPVPVLQPPLFRPLPDSKQDEATKTTPAPAIKKEVSSDDEAVDLSKIPPAPLPPDPVSKPGFLTGDTSDSGNSKASTAVPDDAPLPPDFLPSQPPKKSKSPVRDAERQALPSQDEDEDDDDDLSDEFENSGEEVDDDDVSSPAEDEDADVPSDEQADHLQTSPESSFKSDDRSLDTSPTGGLFTNVSLKSHKKQSKPLFGEVGSTGPILPPPKPQESPRSPSPVRRLPPAAEALRSETARSVSAPAGARAPLSMIEKRRLEAAQEAAQTKAKIAQELARQKAEQEALARRQAEAAAKELEALQDADEDELLRRELQAPVQPSESLADFVTFQSQPAVEESTKTGVPAQIERLYRDVNRMINTVGLNSRALSAYLHYQQGQEAHENWPSVLNSDTPLDVLNQDWPLGRIPSLQEGYHLLETNLNDSQIDNVAGKLQQCQTLLTQDLLHLRTNVNSIRKSLHLKQTSAAASTASLSAEQASIQQDLRKASASVRGKLAQAEDALAILRAKLAQDGAASEPGRRASLFGHAASPKKPTVEAVMNTIGKMTSMAEKKSADIDVLEAQLRKLKIGSKPPGHAASVIAGRSLNGTPKPLARSSASLTPGSGRSSVYHTPDSKFNRSLTKHNNSNGNGAVVAAEDRAVWQAKARRKKEAAAVLRTVLAERRKQQQQQQGSPAKAAKA